MAANTNPDLQRSIIYSVFPRNHTQAGTLAAIIDDLPRIRSLGADIVWLMPIHPIGELHRKGSMGSPYANRDYRSIDPALGDMADLEALVEAAHEQGMRLIIDVVYNHTSPDSTLWREHPEFFWKKADGTPGNHVGDWSDIIDLDYTVPELWDYQVESLVGWARVVDGFRCDVASFVPVEFWKRARAACEEVRPGCIWLAESVHRHIGAWARRTGLYSARDTEAYEAFDIEYEYDVERSFDGYLSGTTTLAHHLDLLEFQESVYPDNYNKLRYLENHDLPRIASRVGSIDDLESHTAMLFFKKGTTLVYAGQEHALSHQPSLFDRDVIDWEAGHDLSELIRTLARIKHERLDCDDHFFARAAGEHTAVMERYGSAGHALGVFPLRSQSSTIEVELADGSYENLIDGSDVKVAGGKLECAGRPIIICA